MLQKTYITLLFLLVASSAFAQKTERDYLRSGNLSLIHILQERQVTLSKETFMLPEPFLVMATQNPIEQEGTYPLPEAHVDRFRCV